MKKPLVLSPTTTASWRPASARSRTPCGTWRRWSSRRPTGSGARRRIRSRSTGRCASTRSSRRYAIDGTPVDCVYLALLHLVPRRPALVVSGINNGFNLGSDVFYSGTVAGAVEGALRGIPALAVSLERRRPEDFSHAAAFARALAHEIIRRGAEALPDRSLLSVNLPPGRCAATASPFSAGASSVRLGLHRHRCGRPLSGHARRRARPGRRGRRAVRLCAPAGGVCTVSSVGGTDQGSLGRMALATRGQDRHRHGFALIDEAARSATEMNMCLLNERIASREEATSSRS